MIYLSREKTVMRAKELHSWALIFIAAKGGVICFSSLSEYRSFKKEKND